LVRGIVDEPDAVRVTEKSTRRGPLLEVRVTPADLGRVIGRSGRTARALRTVTTALSDDDVRVDIVDVARRWGAPGLFTPERLCRCCTSASAGPLSASAPSRPERARAHGRRDGRTRLLRWHRGPGGDRTGPRSRSRFREHLSRPGPGGRLRRLLGRPRLPRTPVARGPGPGRHRRAG